MAQLDALESQAEIPRPTILLAYSEAAPSAHLVGSFSEAGVAEVVACPVSRVGRELTEDLKPDLILLQTRPDAGSLLGACEAIRDATERPLAVLSTLGDALTITRAFDAGVDEYFVLPMEESELLARLRALLRRSLASAASQLAFGGLRLLPDEQKAQLAGRVIALTPMEYRLLACLVAAQGHVVTHDYLMANVWGAEYIESRHYLHLYIRYLRDKLEDDPKNPRLIVSEWGIGYKLQPLPTHRGS